MINFESKVKYMKKTYGRISGGAQREAAAIPSNSSFTAWFAASARRASKDSAQEPGHEDVVVTSKTAGRHLTRTGRTSPTRSSPGAHGRGLDVRAFAHATFHGDIRKPRAEAEVIDPLRRNVGVAVGSC